MASAKETIGNITTCSICFETFNIPKCLPCSHNFCEGCLQTYITSAFRIASDAKGISCSVCRDFVTKPVDADIANWAKDFPESHVLINSIDMNKAKTDSWLCQACKRQNKTKTAASWCVDCCEALCNACECCHSNLKICLQHKVIPISTLEETGYSLQGAELYCNEHPDKKLEAYCADHSAACCLSCVLLQHIKCKDVKSTEDAVKSKLSHLEESFVDLNNYLQKLVENRVQNKIELEKEITTAKSDVESFFTNTFAELEALRERTIQEITTVEKEVVPSIENEKDELQNKIAAYENNLQFLRTHIENAAPTDILQEIAKLSNQECVLITFLRKMRKTLKNIRLAFKSDNDISEVMGSVQCHDLVSLERENILGIRPPLVVMDMSSVNYELVNSIDIGGHNRGVAFINSDLFLISRHETIELRDVDGTLHASLELPGKPYGIKMLNSEEGAVAVSNKCLLFFNVKNKGIIETKRINVPVKYDFTVHRGNYFIGSENKVTVYHSSYQYERDIEAEETVGYMETRYDGALCYTCYDGFKMHCITADGNSVFEYTHEDLKGTGGINVDKDGNIYVCGFHSKNIHQLKSDGTLNRIMFELPNCPYGLAFNKDYSKAVIVCSEGILVYELSESNEN